MLNFREELEKIKAKKMESRELCNAERILREGVLSYFENEVSLENLSNGVEVAVYHCDKCLLITSRFGVLYQQDFADVRDSSEAFNSIKEKLKSEGCEITEETKYRYVVIVKA